MGANARYTPQVRQAAVASYYELLSKGQSQARARREAGQAHQVNPSSLRTWIERGTDWTPVGQGHEAQAGVTQLRHEMAALRHQVDQLTARQQIVAAGLSLLDPDSTQPTADQLATLVAEQTKKHPPILVKEVLKEVFGWRWHQPPPAPSRRRIDDAVAANQIWNLWVDNYRCYGVDKMMHLLRLSGVKDSRDRVKRLMAMSGAKGVSPDGRSVRIGVLSKPAKYSWNPMDWPLPDRLNRWWSVDMTVVASDSGQIWVGFVTDLASRRILACSIEPIAAVLSSKTLLEKAIKARTQIGPPVRYPIPMVTIATDLKAEDYPHIPALKLENAQSTVMHTTATLYLTECLGQAESTLNDIAALMHATNQWVQWNNHDRLHSALNLATPSQIETTLNAPPGYWQRKSYLTHEIT